MSGLLGPADFYQTVANPCYEKMMDVLQQLQKDVDQDVRYFSAYTITNNVHNRPIVSAQQTCHTLAPSYKDLQSLDSENCSGTV